MARIEVVSIIYQPPRVLLGMKKARFGKGKYNGFGGGLAEGESLEECVIRETLEEAGIILVNPERAGKLLFQFKTGEQDHVVHFFRASKFRETPKESEKIKPEWFDEGKIPYNQMWPADKYWLPMLLAGKKFIGRFIYDRESESGIYLHRIKEVRSLA